MSTQDRQAARDAVAASLLRDDNYRRLFVAQSVSLLGDWMLFSVLPVWAYALTGSAVLAGSMLAAMAAPIVLAAVLGVYVDVWDRQRLLVLSDVARAALVALLLFVRGPESLPLFYVVLVPLALLSGMFVAARSAALPQLVAPEALGAANGALHAAETLARLAGPGLGAALFLALGATPVIAIEIVSFLVSAALLAGMRWPAAARHGGARGDLGALRAQMHEGLAALSGSAVLRRTTLAWGLGTLGAGGFAVLLLPLLRDGLGVSEGYYGLLTTVLGVGTAVGAVLGGLALRRLEAPALFAWSNLLMVGPLLLLAAAAELVVAALALFGVGALTGAIFVAAATIFQLGAADGVRGRVESLVGTVAALAQLAALALAGGLADGFGVRAAMLSGTGIVAMAAVYALLHLRGLALRPAESQGPAKAAAGPAPAPWKPRRGGMPASAQG